jgi:transposase
MMEQMILSKNHRFGRSSEKMHDANQISFMEVDGVIVFFNEAEAECNLDMEEPDDLEIKHTRKPKTKGKCEQDIKGLDTIRIDHYMTEEELISEFGVNGWLSGLSYSGKRA